MSRTNRVTPLGELVAVPDRGLVYGNRGCLHDEAGAIRRRFVGQRWIACRLRFRGRRRSGLMMPGRYTELFFLDEATALAAGHRPCAECRRDDYVRLRERWTAAGLSAAGADAIDARLHGERLGADGHRRRHEGDWATLPDGTFVLDDDGAWLVHADALRRWTPGGYTDVRARPARGRAVVLTPPSLVLLLEGGWESAVPVLHPSAG